MCLHLQAGYLLNRSQMVNILLLFNGIIVDFMRSGFSERRGQCLLTGALREGALAVTVNTVVTEL
jgi:hypothetical protein